MSVRALVSLGVVALTLAGCGTSPREAVRGKVQEFGRAARSHDYKTICGDVLAPALVAHLTANGISCEQALAVSLGTVQKPALSIGKVTVKGSEASVITLTVAAGQASSVDTIELTHTGGGWRIISLRSL